MKSLAIGTKKSAAEVSADFNDEIAAGAYQTQLDGVDLSRYGPPFGTTPTADFLIDCIRKSGGPQLSLKTNAKMIGRLKAAMNCTGCHDGKKLGILNYSIGEAGEPDLLDIMVRSGHMPPKSNDRAAPDTYLGPEWRFWLKGCLVKQYKSGYFQNLSYNPGDSPGPPGVLKKYLNAVACPETDAEALAPLTLSVAPVRSVAPVTGKAPSWTAGTVNSGAAAGRR